MYTNVVFIKLVGQYPCSISDGMAHMLKGFAAQIHNVNPV